MNPLVFLMKGLFVFSFAMVALGVNQDASIASEQIHPCKADIEKFCKDVKPGAGRIKRCLRRHQSELSEPCKKKHQKRKEKLKKFKEACASDVEKLCGKAIGSHRKLVKCLKRRESQLTEECREAMRGAPKARPHETNQDGG